MTTGEILLLGGSQEAHELAHGLRGAGRDVVISFATPTNGLGPLPIRSRVGGFGGVPGLVAELQRGGYRLLIDATHPFAWRMGRNALAASSIAQVAHLRLLRPAWQAVAGDRWFEVDDLAAAARRLDELGARRAFLAIGRRELGPFAELLSVQFVLRALVAPTELFLEDATVLVARGPFGVDAETALLREQRIDAVVTRNSGSRATAAKLEAARALGIPVIMVRRPQGLQCEQVATVGAALAWVDERVVRD